MTRRLPAGPPRHLLGYLAGHALVTIGEWGVLIPLLLYAYDTSGPGSVGVVSMVAISPYVLLSPLTARVAQRRPPGTVRLVAMLAQAVGFLLAGAVVLAEGSLWLATAGVIIGYTASTALRPAAAVLLPAVVRSTRELTTANVFVGHGDTASLFVGPSLAAVVIAVGGPGWSLVVSAAITFIGVVVSVPTTRHGPPNAYADDAPEVGRLRMLVGPFVDVAHMVRRPALRGVLVVSIAQFVLVGASDTIWVVIAGEHIDLGSAGAGVLSALFGLGSLLCVLVSGRAARRTRVAPLMLVCIGVIAVACIAFGLNVGVLTAVAFIPLLGLSRGVLDVLARLLLQRSAPPSELAVLFGAVETLAGLGGVLGALLAQVLVSWRGAPTALIGLGVVFVVILAVFARSLRSADDRADVPVVAMSLLRTLPVFAPLPVWSLEAVARSARELDSPRGTSVISEGEPGDAYYAIVDGRFEVTQEGRHIRELGRSDGFGELALLADVPRTATVRAATDGRLLAIDRDPFLVAVTGHEPAHDAAWTVIGSFDDRRGT